MRSQTRFLAALASAAMTATVALAGQCVVEDECEFFASNANKSALYRFDLKGLCKDGDVDDYKYPADAKEGTRYYEFNICGLTNNYCLPAGYQLPYIRGTAIQYLGGDAKPSGRCNEPYTNKTLDCTYDCEVIAKGGPQFVPFFQLRNETDPATGGIIVQHLGEPSLAGDEHMCPFDEKVGGFLPRNVLFNMTCGTPSDSSSPLEVTKFEESPQCTYIFHITSKFACGSLYSGGTSDDPNSGSSDSESDSSKHSADGIAALLFFVGVIVAGGAMAGLWYWRKRAGGFNFSFARNSAASSATSTAFGANAGSAKYSTVG